MAEKKLLYVINHMDWFWSHRLPLAQGAQEDGWDINVAATGASKDARLSEYNFCGIELPPSDKGFLPFATLKIIWAIHKIIKQTRPNLIHVITLKYAFIAGLAVRLHKDVKIVHTIAGLGYLFSGEGLKPKLLRLIVGPFLKIALQHPRAQIIFQNPDDERLLISRGFVNPAQCHLIRGSGVDLEQFSSSKEPAGNTPLAVMPTRLIHDKGVAVFVEAARILKNKGIQARFQIAGGITRTNPLAITKEEIENMVSDGAVEWLGKVDDMPGLLAASALIVYPSYYREGIPKVLLEAVATGRAIVTTDHPGCREAVTHNENGLLVPIKDPQATADAIQSLLENPEMRATMGKKSRQRAKEEFDVRIIVKRTLSVYNTAFIS